MADSLRDFLNAWRRRLTRRAEINDRDLYLDALDRCIRIPEPHPAESGRGLWADVMPEIVVMHDHAVGRLYEDRRDSTIR